MVVASAVITTLYLGGWQFPFVESFGFSPFVVSVLQVGAFAAKVAALLFFFILIRWTVPRFRYDQLMNLGWKVMLPISLANILVTGIFLL